MNIIGFLQERGYNFNLLIECKNKMFWNDFPGIYGFYNTSFRRMYIGQSEDISNRFKSHFGEIKKWFPNDFIENYFYFAILEKNVFLEKLLEQEKIWIERMFLLSRRGHFWLSNSFYNHVIQEL